MKTTVFKCFSFSAAHHLDIPGHPCSKTHGHNYTLRIEITGERKADGFVIDFHDIRSVVAPLVDMLDHSLLNDVVPDTTAEGLCEWFLDKLDGILPGISRIEVRETDSCGAFITL
jgi:6-pyruvoyltetrahydropterin/6-carboxytetrahydropterin synthase